MTDQVADISSPIGLIAGGGVLPFAVAESLSARDVTPVLFPLKGFCDPEQVNRFRHRWVALGQFGKMMSAMRSEGCRDIVFIGSLVRPALSDLRLDWKTIRLIPTIVKGLRGGDDHMLSATADMFERDGFRLLGLHDVAPDLLMPEGCVTFAKPDDAALSDIAMGRDVLRATGPFDIGQGAVVIDRHIVSLEDIGGTDSLLARVAGLREEGRLRAKPGRGVLVKAPKPGQDLRFDLPALGPRTVAGAAAAGLAGIAIAAGHSVVAEPQAMIEAADKAGLFVIGLPA
ncbi:hypothetical protein ASC80_06250 [Afipia sp. Root123D2]|uniref:LpxI family protein n=1 Tax=Afipia sp. Root123D2 TaxID=1736436 RepID=UPI0006F3C743|nr:UDP-2,3-diacylglucosamine diphosphatase LpxI [Afipia sp. Root123D2]KQW22928.1 hypothetical protein ASC80_06250 [Afipia sp. Root123D2]